VVRGGNGDDSRSSGWLLILGIAVVAALVSLLGHHASTPTSIQPSLEPRPPAAPTPLPSVSASPSANPSASSAPSGSVAAAPPGPTDPTAAVLAQIGGYVSVGEVCKPVTDGRSALTVRFLLRNVTGLPEQLARVSPELPMGGLRPRGTTVQQGTCAKPTGKPSAPARNPLPAGGSLVVSLHFALPKSCPAPYPVQAVVTVGIAGVQRSDTVALYTDLGTLKFDLCTAKPTA
jgi:hypothetical protein